MKVESLFISDVHLGQSGCRAAELLAFLAEVEAKNIFVIGDLIDLRAMRRSAWWPQAHQDVLHLLLDQARSGVRVVYIPGNHDEAAREFAGMVICGVEVRRQLVHRTVDGRKILLLHGDELDPEVRCGKWQVALGSVAYSLALRANGFIYRARRVIGLPDWSVTAWLKRFVAGARTYIEFFERAAAGAAARAGCDGVICGHIHHPATREIEGVLYMNDGDWVENCTALVETMSGRLSLLRWSRVALRARVRTQRSLRLLGSSKA
jgi:UDP-2,3-diacylglucosamine pyrophosphatase LpxH